ncbi:type IV pilus assembly protein PilO [Salirhabdus euzebyi]|uniref:Type IV pilus assembly protein PilO n=1 Tax=Salirhabdus euzebyi TaxID=394506 RepID=A0A841Q994_9BACI|nr:hypothetical protein [Salirhabdus euzebyi]MBB6455061.1 type IV pilus assembly protein PilO [Salirhabdus euzebyi]
MKKWNSGQKIILFALTFIVLLGIGGAYFFSVKPLMENQEQAESSLSNEQLLYEKISEQYKEQQQVDRSRDSLVLQKQLPLDPFYEQLFWEVNEAQAISNSVVTSYNISEPIQFTLSTMDGAEGEELMQVTFSLQVTSPAYPNMIDFVDRLENSERIVSIEQVSFTQPDSEESLQYDLTFSAFYKEGLNTLRGSNPTIAIPAPANKDNPLQ